MSVEPISPVDPYAALHVAIAALHTAAPPAHLGHAVAEVDRAIRRLSAVKLRLLAAAEHARVAADAGFGDTGSWAARQTTASRATAAREVALATELDSETFAATATALDDGDLSPAHAEVIVAAGRRLPTRLTPQQRAEIEQRLLDQARRLPPDQLRRVARRALEAVEPDRAAVDAQENAQVCDEERRALARTRLSWHDLDDGTTSLHAVLPAAVAAVLRRAVESLTSPRRMRGDGLAEAAAAEGGPTIDSWDWAHRRGLALVELIEHLPTDRLHPRTAATVVVTVDHTALTGALKVAGLDTGEQISAGEARRLACGAGLVPAVLDGASHVLDLGRQTRLFSEVQRTALAAVHRTCAADGCERPFAWCELHHRRPWSRGGRTDLAEAVPLCHWHHRRIHDDAYDHRRLPDGSLRFTRRT